jgi:hypothetical protein
MTLLAKVIRTKKEEIVSVGVEKTVEVGVFLQWGLGSGPGARAGSSVRVQSQGPEPGSRARAQGMGQGRVQRQGPEPGARAWARAGVRVEGRGQASRQSNNNK